MRLFTESSPTRLFVFSRRSSPPIDPAKSERLEVYEPFRSFEGRYAILWGGAGSGKSVEVTEKLIDRCLSDERSRFLVLRKVARTLRQSVFAEFKKTLDRRGQEGLARCYEGELRIRFYNGAEIIFAGLDDREKLKSLAHITGLWIEEATEITEKDFEQANLRVRGEVVGYRQTILTFNPIDSRHWIKRKFFDTKPSQPLLTIHSTWRDNPYSGYTQADFDDIGDDDYRGVYELGLWGQGRKGLIYPVWTTTELDFDFEFAGLDWGYRQPLALIGMSIVDDRELLCREVVYQTELTTPTLIEILRSKDFSTTLPIFCDAADPEAIQELVDAGYNALPADKSVLSGIRAVQSYTFDKERRPDRNLIIHADSVNIMSEFDSYKWIESKEGEPIDRPVKWNDHAADAIRYGVKSFVNYVDDWTIND